MSFCAWRLSTCCCMHLFFFFFNKCHFFIPFYGWVMLHCMNELHLFTYSLVDEHLGWFHFLVIWIILLCLFLCSFGISVSFQFSWPSVKLLDHVLIPCVTFEELPSVFHNSFTIVCSHQQCGNVLASPHFHWYLPFFLCCFCYNFIYLNGKGS